MVVRRVPHFRFHLQHLVVLYRGSAAADPTVRRSKDEARARAEEALKRIEADPASWQRVASDREGRAPDGESGLNYLCAGYRMFFNHIDGPMRRMAGLLQSGRFADEIMTIEAGAPA